MDIPISQQFPIFMKILECNKGYSVHDDSLLTIAIIFQSNNKQSLTTHDDIIGLTSQFTQQRISALAIKFVEFDLDRIGDLSASFSAEKVDVAYISPLRAYKIEDIADICKAKSILSLTGMTSYLNLGLAVSIANRGGKPQIVINLPAAKAEKANFGSQILKLARIME